VAVAVEVVGPKDRELFVGRHRARPVAENAPDLQAARDETVRFTYLIESELSN
jgi:hypothetical protein